MLISWYFVSFVYLVGIITSWVTFLETKFLQKVYHILTVTKYDTGVWKKRG